MVVRAGVTERGALERENLARLEKEMDDFESEMESHLTKISKNPLRIEINLKP